MPSVKEQGKAGWKEWTGLVVLMLPVLIISITVTALFFALPALTAEMEPTASEQLWIVDIYTFVLAGLLIPMGSLGDRIGMRRLLLVGSATFAVTSVVAAYAPNAETLIAMRALQGAAAATLMPPTLALIRNLFRDTRQRQMAMALWATMLSVGSVIGPITGGWMLEYFWWGSVFLVNVPFMIILLIAGPLLLPETRPNREGRFDLLSGGLILLAVLPIVYAVKQIAAGVIGIPVWGAIVVGLVVGVLFIQRQRKIEHPMLDLALFRTSAFSISLIAAGLTLFALVGTTYFITQYLMLVLEMRPLIAGVMTLPAAVGSVAGALLGAAFTRRIRPGFVVGSGLIVMSVGFLLLTQLSVEANLPLLFGGMALVGWGIGSVSALASDMVVANSPREKAGSASALFESTVEFGGALGAAVLGSVGAAIYRSSLAERLPEGLPTEVVATAQTLGGALAAAGQLAADTAAALVTAAREAYIDGTQAAAATGAVLTVLMGILAMVYLRKTKIVEEEHSHGEPAPLDRNVG
ncbi:MFS transporter [Marinactinospora thermotolerans]|uniref:MFS transporter, DHA2 family, multidrug resistance protein n=1 Tax=Marinactinospora thermotolerans DSM 45154 TaxID=1122192 RepID=A0A1T4QZI6_9ACTN|nr:MFS transporter [Marinactinospora thermotolerans]SKA09144.1 MFS transporter, DHA2 family, multidrug resistance protein [Marinactinospora thermotolerans DSM 45154]